MISEEEKKLIREGLLLSETAQVWVSRNIWASEGPHDVKKWLRIMWEYLNPND